MHYESVPSVCALRLSPRIPRTEVLTDSCKRSPFALVKQTQFLVNVHVGIRWCKIGGMWRLWEGVVLPHLKNSVPVHDHLLMSGNKTQLWILLSSFERQISNNKCTTQLLFFYWENMCLELWQMQLPSQMRTFQYCILWHILYYCMLMTKMIKENSNFLICINDAVYHCCIMQLICTETKSGELSPSTAMLPQSGSSSCALQQGLNPMFFGALHLHWNCALPTKLVYVKKNLFFLSCTYDK